ncbi:MAG: threonine ammonia-lyase [Halobacteriaceae archaeon]
MTITVQDIRDAQHRLKQTNIVRRTSLQSNQSLSEMTQADIVLKMEHLQRTGSFKPRGAYNKLHKIKESDRVESVIAASAGNHAQGVALAAAEIGLDATIVMPKDAPQTKISATQKHGAEVKLHGSTFGEAESRALDLSETSDKAFIPAYDDPDIIAGQGTIGLEINNQREDIDTVIVPIGGGGLISGIAVALKDLNPNIRVVGVQAEGAATVPQSLQKGIPQTLESPDTIADGIATGAISELTLELITNHVDEIVTVDDNQISNSILVLLEQTKQLVEGAGAAPIAALLSNELDVRNETVVPILSGGNIDISMLQTVLTQAMADRNQMIELRVRINDTPGKMAEISDCIATEEGNIRTVRHERGIKDLDVGEAFLVFEIETGGEEHAEAIKNRIETIGYEVNQLN